MADIDHVVVLMLENRSFDHMLGFLPHPAPEFDGLLRGGPYTNPGWNGAPPVTAMPQAKRVLPTGPDHSHDAVLAVDLLDEVVSADFGDDGFRDPLPRRFVDLLPEPWLPRSRIRRWRTC